ncbi:MAG: flagellar assembly peptidoglycan hydrolase FlgJ [Woeseiaceae bacterium]
MTQINDFSQFTTLRAEAQKDSEKTLRKVAEQFEALFVQQMLKSMRDASFGDPIFGEAGQGGMFRDMFDQQIAGDIASGPGIGLADLLVRQMQPEQAVRRSAKNAIPTVSAINAAVPEVSAPSEPAAVEWNGADEFVSAMLPFAKKAAASLGVNPLAVLAQAALETGWGKHVMPDASGASSLNLFGIKASGSWEGDFVNKSTIEFQDGVARREQAPFRVYQDLAATFSDYAGFLLGNERYQSVKDQQDDVAGFGQALQDSGYATDPSYGRKIARVAGGETMQRILGALKETDLLTLSHRIGDAR